MNDLDKLFGLLTKTKLYTNSKEEFIEKYSTPENQDKLFGLLSKTKLYTNSKEDFMSKYFPTAEPPKDEGVISREELLKEIDKPKGGSPEAVDTTDSNFASGGTSSSSESRFGLEDKLIQKKSTISNPRIKSIEDIKRSLSGYKAVKDYDNKFLEEVPAEDKKTYIDRARKKLEGEYSEAYKDIDKESNLGFNITESLINKEAVNLIKGDRDKKLYEGTDMSEQAKLKLKSGFLSTGSNLAGVPNFINKSLFTLFAPDDLVEELNKLTPEQREAVINQNMPKVGSINLVGSIGMLSAETQNKLKERANKVSESIVQFDRSIGQDFSDGNWGKALFRAFNEGAASAPSLVQAVIPYVGLPSIALGSMSGKQEELEDEGFGLGYDTTLNSVVTGTAEAVFERVTQKLGGKLIDAFKKAPLNGRQQMVSALKQVATGVGEEGGSEALTSTVQILSDVLISGKEKDIEDAFEEVIDAFIVGGAMGGMVSSVTQGVTQLKSLKEELDINKIVASDSNNFKDVSDAFDTGSKVEPSSLDLLSLSTTDYVLDKTLNKKVKRGEITEGQSKAIKKNYLESKQAYEKTKAIKGISSDNQVKATNLLKRKAQLIEEIAKSDDILSQPKKQELESINKNLEEILASPEEKLAKEKIEEVTKKIKDDKDVQEQEINKTEDKEAKDQDSQEGVQEVTTTKKTTKVSEAINRPVTVTTLGGSKLDTPIEGDMYVEGQQVVIEDVDGNITELGNVDEVSDSTLGELGVEIQEESVEVTNKGNLKIGDDVLVPERSGIKKDKRGNVSRVVLRTEDGSKTVTLRGAKAEDAAYQILLKEAMSPEQNQAINEKLEQDEEFQNKLREAEESTKERTDKDTTEVTEQTKSEPEVKKDNKLTEGTKKVLKQVELAKKAVKKILPNVEFVIHNTTAELEKATGQVARGVFERSANGKNNKIHISLEGANDRTVAHEVFHAVLANKLGSESRIQKVTADMVSRLSKNLDPKTNETLIRFMNKYKDTNPEDMNEEFVSELFGMLANDYTKFDRSTKHLVKRWLNKVAEQLGLGEFIRFKDTAKDEEVMQLLETVAGKVSLGEVVSEGDVTMLVSNGTIKAPKKYKSSKFVDDMVLERWDTHKNTKVIKDFDLKDIEGQSASSTLSDKLVAGKLGNFKLFGGVGYPEATGLLWAASSRRAAQLIVSKIKRSMDGNNYLVPAIMSNLSHMSNKDMTVVAIEVLKEAAGNKELDIKGLKENVDRVFKKNALLKFREGAIESVKDSKDVIKGLDSFLDFLLNPKFTFERRRAVLESLIGESKVGKAKFKTVGTFTQLAESLAEPMVKDSGIYQVDIVFRTKGDLKVVEIKKEDPRYHKSYPFAIESSDIIESLHLKNSYNLVDIFPEFTKESGEVKSLAQEFADKRGKYSDEYIRTNFGRTHGLSKYSEPIVADKPIMKSQKWDESKRGKQRLEGAPLMKKRKNVSGADLELTNLAEAYAKDKGIDYRRQSEYVKVDPNRAKRIAEEYEKMKHEPNNPKVKEAYQNLIDQTLDQYKVLKDAGYEFYFFDETNDPYNGSPWAAMEELRNDKKMAVFSTESGFGTDEKVDVSDNPMLADTGFKWEYKGKMRPVLANDLFRAVHDAFGHGIEGSGFRARGEENAWQAHARLFTGSAVAAITTETRGQNSWLNYGKFGEQNRTASVEETIFADQKTGLMPEWTWKEGFDEGVEPKSTFKSQKVGYRAGDLKVKAERIGKFSNYRDTGHFGTGFYFVSNLNKAKDYGKVTGGRAISKIENLNNYKLADGSEALHKSLKEINDNYLDNNKVKGSDVSNVIRVLGMEDNTTNPYKLPRNNKEYNQLLKEGMTEEQISALQDSFDSFEEKRGSIASGVVKEVNLKLKDNANQDSASTLVMKALGFEGVNSMGTSLDNFQYGSVVYDLKSNRTFKSQKVDKENYDKIRENSKRYRQEIGNKHKTVTSRFKDFMAKSYDASVDRQGLVKKALNKIGLNDVVSYMVTRAGAASFAKSKIEDAYKKTFSDLTADEWVYLEEIIQLKRTISIEKNRADRGLEMIDRMGGFDAEMSESALREYKRVLGDDVYAKLEKRSENYFKVFKDILKDMKSEGLINQEFYDRFAEVDYKPTAYVKFLLDMDGDFLETEADRVGSFGLSGDMIRNMKKGSVGLEVMDAWGLLQGAMITRTKANFANRLNSTFAEEFEKTSKRADELVKKDKSDLTKEEAKFLEDFANVKANVKMDSFVYRTKKDGTVVQKFKSEGKNNKGWKFLYYYKDGVKNRVQMKEEFFNKFTDTSLELMPSGTKDVISTLSGTKLVKSLATGNNPLFFITNLPRDFMFTLMFSKEYSNNIIPNTVRLVRDMTKGIKDVVTDSDSYKKYLEYGGGMDFLSLQGRYKEGTLGQKMISKVLSQKTVDKITQNKALKAFGKFNLASEAGLRLVVFNKSIQNQLKDLGVKSVEEIKDKKQVDLIYTNAVRSAREMTDFNQGGTVSKAVDSFVPYLNASIQGTRAATREIKERPWDFTIRAVQVAGVSASFALSTSMSIMMLTKGDEEDEDMKLADKYFKTLETISEYDLRNYFIIPLGVKDSNKNWKYLRVAKSHFMTPLINAAEHAQRKFMAGQTGNKYHEELGKTLKSSVSNNILPIIPDLDVTQRIPAVGAGIAMLGIDPYTGNNLDWKRGEVYTQNEGIVDDRVDPMYKAIGLSLGVAPARLQKATESFITSPSVNLYVGASYVMGNMTSKALSSHDLGDYTITETFTEPLFRRLVKSGSDYNYKSKVLKPDTSEGAEVDRAVIYRKKGVKEAGMLIKEGKSEEALKKITELIEKYPEDAKLIRAGLNNEVAKKSKHPIINEILFERNPKKKAFMLYQLFGDDLVNISSKDKELRETFIQLRKDKAITRDVLKYYFDHVSEVKSKK